MRLSCTADSQKPVISLAPGKLLRMQAPLSELHRAGYAPEDAWALGQLFTLCLPSHCVQELLSTLQLGCTSCGNSKMLLQPRLPPRLRQRHIISEQPQQMAPLEAIGMLPSVAGAMVRGSSLPTSSVTTHPGCTMRMSLAPALRRCQGRVKNKEDPARGKCSGWLEKVEAAIKPPHKTAAKPSLISSQNRAALPQISKENKGFEKPAQKRPCLRACSSQVKRAPPGNEDMKPWSGPSQSETSFQAFFKPVVSLLHSVPFSAAGAPGCCSFSPELGEKAVAAEQKQKAKRLRGKTRPKGRSRGLPQHFRSKWQEIKLPPVPCITNLNFSRNFTFSFFELPPHQNHQHWVQRQQLIHLLLKQLK